MHCGAKLWMNNYVSHLNVLRYLYWVATTANSSKLNITGINVFCDTKFSQKYKRQILNKHSDSADLCQGESSQDLESRRLPKFSPNFFVQRYICGTIFMKIQLGVPEIWAKLWEKVSCNIEESFKKIPRSSSRSGTLPRLNQFFLVVHSYISWRSSWWSC